MKEYRDYKQSREQRDSQISPNQFGPVADCHRHRHANWYVQEEQLMVAREALR